eukprot:g6583.t1
MDAIEANPRKFMRATPNGVCGNLLSALQSNAAALTEVADEASEEWAENFAANAIAEAIADFRNCVEFGTTTDALEAAKLLARVLERGPNW